MRATLIMSLAGEHSVLPAGAIIEGDFAVRAVADGVAIPLEDTAPVPEKKAEKPPVRDAKAK